MAEFADKVVIVSGGSQNIGYAIGQAFLAAGATVVAADLNPPTEAENGLSYITTNVADEHSVAGLMSQVMRDYGRLDVLVNNAGIAIETHLHETSVEDWDRVMGINVKGVFLMCKHAFGVMQTKSQDPAIVNISSIEGLAANPMHAAYGASKGAVASLTHNIALEYGPHGIRCNAIAPGWINTPFNEELLNQFPDRERVDAEIKSLHPLGRLGQPADIAEAAVWLASPRSAFITGQEIVVDGGRLAKLPLPSL